MSVTIVICSVPKCGRMLNGELTNFIGRKPFCNEHFAEARPDKIVEVVRNYDEEFLFHQT